MTLRTIGAERAPRWAGRSPAGQPPATADPGGTQALQKGPQAVPSAGQKSSSVQPTLGAQAHSRQTHAEALWPRVWITFPNFSASSPSLPAISTSRTGASVSLSLSPRATRLTERRKARGTLPPAPGRGQSHAPDGSRHPTRTALQRAGWPTRPESEFQRLHSPR